MKSTGDLADKKNEAYRIGEAVMERRFVRSNMQLPVDLVCTGKGRGFESPAGVVDASQGGLRVRTGPPLVPGRFVHVFLQGKADPFAYCRVVWAQTHGGALPSEAGLEILEQLSAIPCSGQAEAANCH